MSGASPLIAWSAETASVHVATASSGLFVLIGLLAGVWKYQQITASPDHRAHVYVDIAHRASLMYSFASLVLAKLAASSALPESVNVAAVASPVFFFAVAIGTYLRLGVTRASENQFERRTFSTTSGMWLLIAGEIGGVAVLLAGVVLASLRP